ncbi:hypothetical protein JNW91_22270 [Micromonospora sp. STR1_7]|uniref:Uncharacterized protein n=1 Tax=Micromonospora parastrephiae TaxID=2806101 RepID=A0ABS1XYI8_9ACTN|nr:hypothetical protein [Micromonospora parastrephiae]MBM0234326.1 hypothetical protein [Micromonospora parastrephiae]
MPNGVERRRRRGLDVLALLRKRRAEEGTDPDAGRYAARRADALARAAAWAQLHRW